MSTSEIMAQVIGAVLISALCIGFYCLYTGAFTGALNKFLQSGSILFAIHRTWKNKASTTMPSE